MTFGACGAMIHLTCINKRVYSLAMFNRIVIKPIKLTAVLASLVLLAACGQKGPLQPQPMPEQNQPSQDEALTYQGSDADSSLNKVG